MFPDTEELRAQDEEQLGMSLVKEEKWITLLDHNRGMRCKDTFPILVHVTGVN